MSKELLTLLHGWALRPEATREEREVLGHGLALAEEHARARGDAALVSKIKTAMAALPTPAEQGAKGSALADIRVGA